MRGSLYLNQSEAKILKSVFEAEKNGEKNGITGYYLNNMNKQNRIPIATFQKHEDRLAKLHCLQLVKKKKSRKKKLLEKRPYQITTLGYFLLIKTLAESNDLSLDDMLKKIPFIELKWGDLEKIKALKEPYWKERLWFILFETLSCIEISNISEALTDMGKHTRHLLQTTELFFGSFSIVLRKKFELDDIQLNSAINNNSNDEILNRVVFLFYYNLIFDLYRLHDTNNKAFQTTLKKVNNIIYSDHELRSIFESGISEVGSALQKPKFLELLIHTLKSQHQF